MRRALRWAAAGVALPPSFLALLAAGVPAPWAAALLGGGALLPAALGAPAAEPAALLAAAAGIAAGGLLLLPAAGIGGALAAAAALACCGQAPRYGQVAAQAETAPAVDGALALFCLTALWRCASFLLGHSLYAACVVAAGAACGAAAGRTARARLAALRQALPGAGPLAACLLGLLALNWLRVAGLNEPQPELVLAATLGRFAFALLAAQLFAAAALFAAGLTGLEERAAFPASPARGAAPLAGLIAASLLPVLGPGGAFCAGALALGAVGAARGLRRWRAHPILSRAVPVALLAAAALAYAGAGVLRELTLARLQAIYPGGALLLWSERAGETLGVYRFATGAPLVLRDGAADGAGAQWAAVTASLPLLAHPSPRVLFQGLLRPEARAAAEALGAQVLYHDGGDCAAALTALGAPAPSTATAACGSWRAPSGPFDAVIVDDGPRPHSPEGALRLTRDAARAWRALLAPGGVLAWRVSAPLDSPPSQRALAALLAEFPQAAAAEVGGGALLLASDRITDNQGDVLARVSPEFLQQQPGIRDVLLAGLPWRAAKAASLPASSAARPLTALPARLRL